MEKEKRTFTEESFEVRAQDVVNGVSALRAEIREALLKAVEPSQKQKVQDALGSYGTETSQDIRVAYDACIKEVIKNFYAKQVVAGAVCEYAWEFGPQKVLALKDNVLAGDKRAARRLAKRIHTFEEVKNFNDRDMQKLLWGIDWLDMVRALKIASEPIRKRFRTNISSHLAKLLDEQLKTSPATLEQSLESQRRILRTASALRLF